MRDSGSAKPGVVSGAVKHLPRLTSPRCLTEAPCVFATPDTGHALMRQLDAKGLAVSKCSAGVQLGHEAA
jgi:hypothetical protein